VDHRPLLTGRQCCGSERHRFWIYVLSEMSHDRHRHVDFLSLRSRRRRWLFQGISPCAGLVVFMRTSKPLTEYELTTTKKCRWCGKEKSLAQFYRRADYPDGHEKVCIACRNGLAPTAKNLYQKLPRVVGKKAGYVIKTRCIRCRAGINTEVRNPTRPVGIYRVDCSRCGTLMIMTLAEVA